MVLASTVNYKDDRSCRIQPLSFFTEGYVLVSCLIYDSADPYGK